VTIAVLLANGFLIQIESLRGGKHKRVCYQKELKGLGLLAQSVVAAWMLEYTFAMMGVALFGLSLLVTRSRAGGKSNKRTDKENDKGIGSMFTDEQIKQNIEELREELREIKQNIEELSEELREIKHEERNIIFKIQLFQAHCKHPETEQVSHCGHLYTRCMICGEEW